MERQEISLLREPEGDVYRRILETGSSCCAVALLVVRPSLPLSDEASATLDRLRPFLIAREEASQWPGTILHGHTASVFKYQLKEDCVAVLKEVCDGLYEWKQPKRPEDLCLLRRDHSPWLVTIAHERDGFFEVSRPEKKDLLQAVPELQDLIGND